MSGTVMKFGPQWIRTLTDGAAPTSATNQNTTITNTNIGGNGNGGSTTTITSSSSSSSSFSTNNTLSNINNNNNNNSNSNNSNSTASSSSTLSSSAVSSYYNNNPALYGNNNSSSNNIGSINNNNTKYKLAEFRYGREEMLALYEPNMEAPDDIKQFTDLFVEKARMPMAMTQMSEEEVKLSTRSWNSEAVLRSASGKIAAAAAAAAGGGSAGGGVGVGSGGSVGVGGAGSNHVSAGISGVGSSLSGHGVMNSTMIDRDTRQLSERGALTAAEVLSSSPRGPPGSLSRVPLGEQRGLLSSLSSRGHPATIRNLVGRGTNMYIRSQSHDDKGIVTGDGSSSGAASAGIGAGGPGSGYDGRFGASNQPRQPNSLRARFENSRTGAGVAGLPSSAKPIDIKAGAETEIPSGGRSVFDKLPSKYNADDKLIRKDMNGRPIQTDWRSREWSAPGQDGASRPPKGIGPPTDDRSWRSTRIGGAGTAEDWRSGGNQTANIVPAPTSSWYVRTDDQRNQRQQLPQNQENLNPSFSVKRDTLRRPSNDDKQGDGDDESINIQPRHRRDSLPEWSIGDPLSGDKVGSFDASGAFREISRDDGNSSVNNSRTKASERQQQQLNHLKRQDQQHKEPHHQGNDFEHLERAAEIMVEKWTSEEEQHEQKSSSSPDFLGNKSNMTSREQHDAHHANIMQNNSIDNRKTSQVQQRKEQHQTGSDQQAATINSGAPANSFESNNQQKLILLPPNHGESQQWYYRDTQGVIQGPFSANDMYEWWKAGYFVKELLVRRACDELFYPLGEVIKMWDRIPFAPIPMNLAPPPPITNQTIHQFRTVAKQLELAASQGRIPPNAYDVAHPGAVLLHGPLLQQQQQQQIHPVLAAASLNQNALAPPDQQANIRQILEAATRQQQQQQQQHEPAIVQQQRNIPVSVPDQNEMQAQLRQLLVQLKNREGFANLNAQEQQEALVRQFVATRGMPQTNVGNGNAVQDQQDHQALRQQQRVRMVPFMPPFLSNDQQERLRYQQELERRQKEEAEKQQQQNRLLMEQRMKVEEEKQRLMEEVQKQRLKKQNEENEKQKQEAEKERILKMGQLKQQQLAKQHEEFKQQMQNQQRLQQQEKQQQQQQHQPQQPLQPQSNSLSTVQQQQQQQIERAKKAAQAHQVQQEQQQQQRKTAWSTVSKPDQEPVSLATLQKLQEEEKERERQRQQQQAQANQQQQQQQQQQIHNFQRQMTWANAAQSKAAPIKTLAEIQKEEEERLARERQRKAKVQPAVASAGVWNNAASHLSWKNPPSDS